MEHAAERPLDAKLGGIEVVWGLIKLENYRMLSEVPASKTLFFRFLVDERRVVWTHLDRCDLEVLEAISAAPASLLPRVEVLRAEGAVPVVLMLTEYEDHVIVVAREEPEPDLHLTTNIRALRALCFKGPLPRPAP